jgi:site-specific recombinase XerD
MLSQQTASSCDINKILTKTFFAEFLHKTRREILPVLQKSTCNGTFVRKQHPFPWRVKEQNGREQQAMVALLQQSNRTALIEHTISLWITTKTEASDSSRTKDSYERAILGFREMALTAGLDLDGFSPTAPIQPRTFEEAEHTLAALGLIAQAWASTASKEKQVQEGISANTYNNRLTIISSFYRFAKERRFFHLDNPIEQIERRKVQDYISARPLFNEQIATAFAKMNRQTLAGKRDYALLLLLLSTGRRASEVRQLQWKDLFIYDGGITIHFHCKGGKELYDHLEPRVVRAMLVYLKAMFQYVPMRSSLASGSLMAPEQPLWLSLSHKRYRQGLSQRGLADIFEHYFGMTKLHATRHTFALTMLKAGATILEIMQRLGHSNIATTSRYLNSLASAENRLASHVLDEMGFASEEETLPAAP